MFKFIIQQNFSLPFIVGYRTDIVSRALAAVLIYEALSSWLWFFSSVRE